MTKEEIEKILDDNEVQDYMEIEGYGEVPMTSFNSNNAAKALQKLFLSKQIDLLNKVYLNNISSEGVVMKLLRERNQLQSELKELQ